MSAVRYLVATTIAALALGANAATAQSQLPTTVSQAGAVLERDSCGVRDSLWIDHYAAGLYVAPGDPITSVRDPGAPKAVRLEMISMKFVPETIPEKWLAALEGALPAGPLARLRKAYRSLGDGDVMTIGYAPGTGVTVQVNGRQVTAVPQHAVIDAILSAWAGEESVDAKLAKLLTDHPC